MNLKKKRRLMHTHTQTFAQHKKLREETMNFNLRDEFRFSFWNQQCNSGVTIRTRSIRMHSLQTAAAAAEANLS